MSKLYKDLVSKLSQYKGLKKVAAYVAAAIPLVALAVVYFIKVYFADKANLVKDKVNDDKADAKYREEKAKTSAKKEEVKTNIEHRNTGIEDLHNKVETVKKSAKTDKEVIESINSWEDVDRKVKR